MASFEGNDMKTLNHGDSGYVIFRKNGSEIEKVFRSKELQFSFNFPYQLLGKFFNFRLYTTGFKILGHKIKGV